MNRNTSIYLDFLRVISALGVVICHANMSFFSIGLNLCNGEFGHKMVVVFFVLSGFLIAYTTEVKNKDLHGYIIDRISRLYPVIIPALLLTFIIDQIGYQFDPGYYGPYIHTASYYAKYFITFFNLNEIWFSSAKPPTNAPFWSLAYEVWYYIIFAVWIYAVKWKRYILLALIFLCIGYKIVLLFPIWLMGVALFKLSKHTVSTIFSVLLFVATSILIIGLVTENIHPVFPVVSRIGDPYFFYSYDFLNDILLGAIVCLNIFAVNSFNRSLIDENNFLIVKIKWFSSVTFSVYLFHFPVMILFGVLGFYNKESVLEVLILVLGIVVFCCFLGYYTEQKRFVFKKILEEKYRKYLLKINQ
ncbi:acyltransferase family protein [Cytophaga hutchinsonii]|uniref:Acyltransferase family protein n=1 Tax=Cytophaga hutchinsonii (strain ATCC 33406 / DSM 1761 / CIP 103989 / NBRC 15051 / NCIMB 9469 / D465) TaxID=269798 RepID=A0A6N4SPE4_CYTH3|nr:acyltransferase [Cytophaga hutchinsonii]ABG58167.1 acyltransferase family protein [Cytophaga hutchinsonii ATCC 33406]SFY02741.1 Peptidoglycan/LPS O-acetylase OafA/YrhL, contains acyltransferase and SGNH-hydrolase domains [Cytophaga hutchinsonii ATCC 33406]